MLPVECSLKLFLAQTSDFNSLSLRKNAYRTPYQCTNGKEKEISCVPAALITPLYFHFQWQYMLENLDFIDFHTLQFCTKISYLLL